MGYDVDISIESNTNCTNCHQFVSEINFTNMVLIKFVQIRGICVHMVAHFEPLFTELNN